MEVLLQKPRTSIVPWRLTIKEDSIVGQLKFRGKIGKTIDEKKSKKGEPYQMFSAYSATKVENGFEYIWVRIVRFNKERENVSRSL